MGSSVSTVRPSDGTSHVSARAGVASAIASAAEMSTVRITRATLTCIRLRIEERMGTVLFRLTLLACGVLAATAGPAFANATIEFVGPTASNGSMVRVIGDADNDVI